MTDSLDRTGRLVVIGVFVALVVDGVDLQMLASALPTVSQELRVSTELVGGAGRRQRVPGALERAGTPEHIRALDADLDRAAVRLRRRQYLAAEPSGNRSHG